MTETVHPHWAYRRRGTQVLCEAFQIKTVDDSTRAYPGWLIEAFRDQRILMNRVNGLWFIDKTEQIPENGWVLWSPQTGLFQFAFTDAGFHEAFEKVIQD